MPFIKGKVSISGSDYLIESGKLKVEVPMTSVIGTPPLASGAVEDVDVDKKAIIRIQIKMDKLVNSPAFPSSYSRSSASTAALGVDAAKDRHGIGMVPPGRFDCFCIP
jgi:hypothetical protein